MVAPELRAAAEAALAEVTRAYVVDADAVAALAAERGLARGRRASRVERRPPRTPANGGSASAWRPRVAASLDAAVRRDSLGAARRLLARCAWLPDLAACLAIQPALPPGWSRGPSRRRRGRHRCRGHAWDQAESVLERRAEAERLADEVAEARGGPRPDPRGREPGRDRGRHRGVAGRGGTAPRRAARPGARRSAEDAERLAARQLEAVVRESAWHDAQAERLGAELERARAHGRERSGRRRRRPTGRGRRPGQRGTGRRGDRGLGSAGRRPPCPARPARRGGSLERGAPGARRSSAAPAPRRPLSWPRNGWRARIAIWRRSAIASERWPRPAMRCAARSPSTTEHELAARAALAETRAADAADRERLALAEQEAAAARDRLRSADERLRTADHADLEARLGLDALRESVIAELAGLGPLGIARLTPAAGVEAGAPERCRRRPSTMRRPNRTRWPRSRPRSPRSCRSGRTDPPADAAAERDPARPASPPVPRARRQSIRTPSTSTRRSRRGWSGLEGQADGPAPGHRPDARPDRRAGRPDLGPVPDHLPGARDRVRSALRAAVRRRLRPAVADRPVGHRCERDRDRGPATGQEGAGAGDAVGRGAGADGGGPAVRDARDPARSRSASSTRSTRRWTRRTSAASPTRCAAWRTRPSSS